MTHNTTRKWLARGGTLALVLACVACNQQTTRSTDACQLTATNHIDHLFAEVSDKLADPLCHYEYPDYRDRLLQAAKGSPGPENEARFAGMLRESIDRGIISKRQGQALFSQYFDAEFYAVKAESRSSCASLRQKQELYTDMREELAYKRQRRSVSAPAVVRTPSFPRMSREGTLRHITRESLQCRRTKPRIAGDSASQAAYMLANSVSPPQGGTWCRCRMLAIGGSASQLTSVSPSSPNSWSSSK